MKREKANEPRPPQELQEPYPPPLPFPVREGGRWARCSRLFRVGFGSPYRSAVLSGLALGAAFPPLPLGFLAWIGMVPLLLHLEGGEPRKAFGWGYVQGLAFNLAALYWIAYLTPLGAVAALLYLPLYPGLFASITAYLARRLGRFGLGLAPFAWTAIEYLRSLGQLGFPWSVLGNTQTRYLPLIQYAEWTGVFGVSFWIVGMNLGLLALVRAWRRGIGRLLPAIALVLLFGCPLACGFIRIPRGTPPGRLSVGIVQPNIAPLDLWQPDGVERAYETLFRMTREAVRTGARLVVWPETAAPTYLRTDERRRAQVQGLADSLGVSILTGSPDYSDADRLSYNSAFLFRPGRRDLARYDKRHLVPFGEAMPYGDLFPSLRRVTFTASGFTSGDFGRGRAVTLFDGPDGRFAVLICFESVFPGLAREAASLGVDLLVNITNDAWFGGTSSPYQHAEIAVFRAIENRISIARCATTGISVFIDPCGRQTRRTGIFHPAVLTEELVSRGPETFYTRHGDRFAQACLGLTALGLLYARRNG